jgi:gas vesicle protein
MESSNANKLMMMGLIGFAAGVLLAPDKGTITREKLKSRADDLAEKAREKSDQAKNKMRELRSKRDKSPDEIVVGLNESEHLVP